MSLESDTRSTLGAFNGLATTYDRHRPGYPEAIWTALFEGLPGDVNAVDIGCGTGISTRALAKRARSVIGVDPGEDMLLTARSASASNANVRFVRGTAEATNLPSEEADLLLAAQAFHWFDPPRALAEFHRVLRPGGRCALLWNLRSEDDPFTVTYNEIVVSAATRLDPSTRAGRLHLAAPLEQSSLFRDVRVVTAPSDHILDWEGLVGRASSASYFPREEPERSERLRRLRVAFDQASRDGAVVLRQEARLTMATRR